MAPFAPSKALHHRHTETLAAIERNGSLESRPEYPYVPLAHVLPAALATATRSGTTSPLEAHACSSSSVAGRQA